MQLTQLPQRQRPAAGGVEPALGVGEFGRLAVDRQLHLLGGELRRRGVSHRFRFRSCGRPGAEPVGGDAADRGQRRPRRAAAFQPFGRGRQPARPVGGDRALEAGVVVAEHRQRDHHHHRPGGDLEGAAAAGERPHQSAATDHQRVEDGGGADPVGEGDGEAAGVEGLRGGDGDDAGQDRPGAGRVDEAEAGADEDARPEAVAALGGVDAAGEARAEGLHPGGQRRRQEQ